MTAPTEPAGLTVRAVPGPRFTDRCTISTWQSGGALYPPVAYILLGHAPPWRPGETTEAIETGLLGMADAMHLRLPTEPLPAAEPRLLLREPHVFLDYGHPTYTLRLPATGTAWRRHVAAGGPARLILGLDPIPPGAGPDAVTAYLDRVAATGRAYIGSITMRRQAPAAAL